MKRTAIDAAQCAQGFRTFMIMRKMGINGEAFRSFISKIMNDVRELVWHQIRLGHIWRRI